MRFIHAADLHIDSPMRGLAKYDGAPVDQLHGATRRAFENLVRFALENDVELVVLAGDNFDQDWRDFNTGLFFTNQLAKLTNEGIKVVVLSGNHDAAGTISRDLRFPEGAYKLAHHACQTIQPEELDLPVAVHGQSYAQRVVDTNMAADYPGPVPGVVNIGVLHTALAGYPDHDPYAPCTVEELRSKGYDYWALGHVHGRSVLHEDPWIVFPGNLQGRHARETGAKGFTVGTVDSGEVSGIEAHDADVVRWAHCNVDISGASDMAEVADQCHTALEDLAESADGRLAATRISLTGRSPAYRQVAEHFDQLEAQIRSGSFELRGEVWVEKIVLDARPQVDIDALRSNPGSIGALFSSISELRSDPALLQQRFRPEFQRLDSKLPSGATDPTSQGALIAALDAAEARLSALLAEEVAS